MRLWGEKIKVRNKRSEDHQIWSEPKTSLQPIQQLIQTQTIFGQHSKQIRPFGHYLQTQNLTERGGKTRGVKKVKKGDKNYMEKLKKQPKFYAREGEVRFVFFTNKPMILLVYKEAYFNTNDLDHIMPSVAISLS